MEIRRVPRTPGAAICILAWIAAAACPRASAVAAPSRTDSLASEIRGILDAAGIDGEEAAIAVYDARGQRRVAIAAERPMRPASNLKILTTLAALEVLGVDHEFVTRIAATAPLQGGVVAGDIELWGNGDPNISGRFHDDDVLHLPRSWAAGLRQAGLVEVRGDLVVDDGYFRGETFPSSWRREQMGHWYAAEVSSLSFNDNCVDFRITPGRPGEPARVDWVPRIDAISVSGAPSTVASGETRIVLRRGIESNRITVGGQIRAGRADWRGHVSVHDPALFFAEVVAASLRAEGIRIGGRVRRAADSEPEAPHVLVDHRSSLALDLPVINKQSQNLHAEILLRALGRKRGGDGSAEAGARAVRGELEAWSLSLDGLEMVDGSGLSHRNRATADLLARSLHAARSKPYFDRFLASLPVAGQDGTLKQRFKDEPGSSSLAGRVHAKTGFIDDVFALSGYIRRGEAMWSFAMLFERRRGGSRDFKRCQERIARAIDAALEGGSDGASDQP